MGFLTSQKNIWDILNPHVHPTSDSQETGKNEKGLLSARSFEIFDGTKMQHHLAISNRDRERNSATNWKLGGNFFISIPKWLSRRKPLNALSSVKWFVFVDPRTENWSNFDRLYLLNHLPNLNAEGSMNLIIFSVGWYAVSSWCSFLFRDSKFVMKFNAIFFFVTQF